MEATNAIGSAYPYVTLPAPVYGHELITIKRGDVHWTELAAHLLAFGAQAGQR